MDYKYIEQLMERYWECQTTLEEEAILRAFFSQDDVPASLLAYRDLFVYEQAEIDSDKLGDEFDKKILARLGSNKPVKAKTVSLTKRMRPLYKAVAVVAVLLTLGNAVQMSLDANRSYVSIAETEADSASSIQMAQADSARVDTIHHTSLAPQEMTDINQTGGEILPVD